MDQFDLMQIDNTDDEETEAGADVNHKHESQHTLVIKSAEV